MPRLRPVFSCLLLSALAILQVVNLSGQTPPQSSGMSTGNSTGAAAQAVYDEQHRPITAGGFVDKGPVIFADISKQSGLASWSHVMGTPDKKYILDADGSGVG